MHKVLRKALGLWLAGVSSAGCVGQEPVVPTFPECATPLVRCGETCVSTDADALHCGDCDTTCAIEHGEICSAGACVLACAGEQTDCGDACADLQSDAAHCGDCAIACDTSAGEVCSAGVCSPLCGTATGACGSSCVNTETDPGHCGDCDTACDAGEACVKGKCALVCSGGTARCGTRCVDLGTDPAHCGDCATACDANAGELCDGGSCTLSCTGGTTRCDDACVDTAIDPSHCGDCNTVCDANAACDGGTCTCADGYEGDGETCSDIDECAGDNDCSPSGECTNTDGGYQCRCLDGQSGDGSACTGFRLVSYRLNGNASGANISALRLSQTGRYVAFTSNAGDLALPTGPGRDRLYRRDVQTNTTIRLSQSSTGADANGKVGQHITLSADGSLAAFVTDSTNLGDTDDGGDDVFVRDVPSGTTTVRSQVGPGAVDGVSGDPALSADGRYLAFWTERELTDEPTKGRRSIYRYDFDEDSYELVSRSSDGKQATAPASCDPEVSKNSYLPSLSSDGKLIAFHNDGTGLSSDLDENCQWDVFVRDLTDPDAPVTLLASVTPDGVACTSGTTQKGSVDPWLSGDGHLVAFTSGCIDLLATADTLDHRDVFVRDLKKGVTTLASVNQDGAEANGDSFSPELSADGRYVAFLSNASDLVADDTNGYTDVFLRDLSKKVTTRISLDAKGVELGDGVLAFGLAPSGAAVAFTTYNDLVPEDTNGLLDGYVRYLR